MMRFAGQELAYEAAVLGAAQRAYMESCRVYDLRKVAREPAPEWGSLRLVEQQGWIGDARPHVEGAWIALAGMQISAAAALARAHVLLRRARTYGTLPASVRNAIDEELGTS